ncbi:uncharacterized protein LMH87_007593 [Akanthomyces muscarius]|uniref:RING-type domain-containing protein n=1 Tax=Akanthomyces muscarius TaxID=2231603 RepID=A0A9W8UR85_AKAMU|nr:uncharacterized protein LMH87_007593 [Akanthomyces muscarius]KAJ4161561.1 hypothetical protein LMH87_007593 [Akanthomyces muscarius]
MRAHREREAHHNKRQSDPPEKDVGPAHKAGWPGHERRSNAKRQRDEQERDDEEGDTGKGAECDADLVTAGHTAADVRCADARRCEQRLGHVRPRRLEEISQASSSVVRCPCRPVDEAFLGSCFANAACGDRAINNTRAEPFIANRPLVASEPLLQEVYCTYRLLVCAEDGASASAVADTAQTRRCLPANRDVPDGETDEELGDAARDETRVCLVCALAGEADDIDCADIQNFLDRPNTFAKQYDWQHCPVCDDSDNLLYTPYSHVVCSVCWGRWKAEKHRCPTCRCPITMALVTAQSTFLVREYVEVGSRRGRG